MAHATCKDTFFNNVTKLTIENQNYSTFFCFRLDQILGRQGSKAKDVYESKQSLASRIVKTERQVKIGADLHI